MATSAIAGFNAQVFISTNGGSTYTAIGETRDATLSITNNEIESTSFDSSGWMEVIGGLKEWEVSTESLYVYSNAGQSALYSSFVAGTSVKIRILPKNTAGLTGYVGDAIINSWEINMVPDDVISLSVGFKGTGTLATYTA